MAACTARMRGGVDQGIRMTAGAVRTSGRHNTAVVRCRGMDCVPGSAVTARTVAASGWNARLQVRNRGMAEAAVAVMNY